MTQSPFRLKETCLRNSDMMSKACRGTIALLVNLALKMSIQLLVIMIKNYARHKYAVTIWGSSGPQTGKS